MNSFFLNFPAISECRTFPRLNWGMSQKKKRLINLKISTKCFLNVIQTFLFCVGCFIVLKCQSSCIYVWRILFSLPQDFWTECCANCSVLGLTIFFVCFKLLCSYDENFDIFSSSTRRKFLGLVAKINGMWWMWKLLIFFRQ